MVRGWRRLLLGCATVLAIAVPVKAQFNVYHTFPDSNAVWGMMAVCTDFGCGTYRYVQDYIAGDTVIDGNAYRKIGQSVSIDYEGCSCTIPEDLGEGYLREDTIAKKVYWKGGAMTQDTLLYDFDMQPGDTLKGYMGTCHYTWTVESIDSILIGPNYRKRINFQIFDSCLRFAIVEGIGSTMGLTTCPYIPFQFGITLQCFTVSDSLLYTTPCGPDLEACSDLTSAISERYADNSPYLRISPNPATDYLSVEFTKTIMPAVLIILDMRGIPMLKFRINQPRVDIDISALAPGPYILLVKKDSALVSYSKLIKQ